MRKGATHLAKQAGRRHSARIRNRADGAGNPDLSQRRRLAADADRRILHRHLDEHSRRISGADHRLERRQRRPRTEYILPQCRLYIRHTNARQHPLKLPADAVSSPNNHSERRFGRFLAFRCARLAGNRQFVHPHPCERRLHGHNHILLHPKRQPARRNRHADGDGNGYRYRYRYCHSNGYAYTDGNRHRHGDSNRYAYRHGYAYTDVDLHCHRDGNSDIDIYAHRNCHAYRHGYSNGYTYRYGNCHANANAHRYAHAYSYA